MTQAPAPVADLTILAAQTRTAIQAGNLAVANGIEHWLTAGDRLIAAKAQTAHGAWLKHLGACDISEDSAERYMLLARNRELVNSARVRNLTLSGALRLIRAKRTEPRGGRRSKPKGAAKVELDSRAWGDASLAERRAFLNAIDFDTVLEAMPASWREPMGQHVPTVPYSTTKAPFRNERARQAYDLELKAVSTTA